MYITYYTKITWLVNYLKKLMGNIFKKFIEILVGINMSEHMKYSPFYCGMIVGIMVGGN